MTDGAARRGPFTERIGAATDFAAPPERVRAALADLARYPGRNPFIRRIGGPLRAGGRLTVRIEPPGGRGMTLRPNLPAVSSPAASCAGAAASRSPARCCRCSARPSLSGPGGASRR